MTNRKPNNSAAAAQLPKNFLQSAAWAKANEYMGHQVLKQIFGKKSTNYLIIKSAKRGRYLEIPGGPILEDWANQTHVNAVFEHIKKLAKVHHCVFVRLRPQLLNTPENLRILQLAGAVPAPMHLHAEHTIIIDLTLPEDTLLANLRRQTRYEVRRAAKLGITVQKANSTALFEEFHQVQLQTAARQNFVPPDLKTLLSERKAFGKNAQIYVAYSESNPVAYALVLAQGTEAAYFEAASTELNRHLPGAYALQWHIIKDLKAQGIEKYNLWGIAPKGVKNHRYAGVTTFKSGFGGQVVEFIPAHDLIISPTRYKLDLAVEKIRKKRRNL